MGTTVVVGAGLAGLTLAERLARTGRRVLVLEKERVPGGLARSFRYGDFVFDVGPHRFHTEDPGVDALLERVLGGGLLRVERRNAVWMLGRYFDWPLRASGLARLPPSVLAGVLRDLLRRPRAGGDSFADHVRRTYGETVFQVFFKPFTERFVGVACEDLSSDWATTGVERALIDRRIRAASLWELAVSALSPPRPLRMAYPAGGGIGEAAERLGGLATEAGAELVMGCEVSSVLHDGSRVRGVRAGGREFDCDRLVWTGTVTEIARLLDCGDTGLSYLHLLLYNYRVRGACAPPYQWCYFNAEQVPFSRVSVPSRFNPRLAPPGHYGLCVELTVRDGAAAWRQPDSLREPVAECLDRLGLLAGADILGVSVERVANAYPIYTRGYRQRLQQARAGIESLRNVHLLGRNATFWYNNMDHSIRAGMRLAEELERGNA